MGTLTKYFIFHRHTFFKRGIRMKPMDINKYFTLFLLPLCLITFGASASAQSYFNFLDVENVSGSGSTATYTDTNGTYRISYSFPSDPQIDAIRLTATRTFNGQQTQLDFGLVDGETRTITLNHDNGVYQYYAESEINDNGDPDGGGTDIDLIGTITVIRQLGSMGAISLPNYCINSYTVSWPAVSAANRYDIEESSNGGSTWTRLTNPAGASATSISRPGINTGEERRYRVRAYYDQQPNTRTPWRTSARCQGNIRPNVSLFSPSNGHYQLLNQVLLLSASATDTNGSVSYVDFYHGTTRIARDTSAPFTAQWTPTQSGAQTLEARATDNHGATTRSTAITVNVHTRPTVFINSPAPNTQFDVGDSVSIGATASDDGTITQVQFFRNGSIISTDTSAPYTATWTVSASGLHSITAQATDNHGITSASSPVVVIEGIEQTAPNSAPTGLAADTGVNNSTGIYTLSWNAVTDANEYELQECRLATCSDGDFTRVIRSANRASSFTGLGNGTYTYRVNACNDLGCSAFSAPYTVTVTLPVPQRPGPTYLKTSAICANGATSGQSTGAFEICWDAITENLDHYLVEEQIGTGPWQQIANQSTTSLVLNNKTTNTYSYRVLACNDQNACSTPGGILSVSVIDTPVLYSASLACDGTCVSITGTGFDTNTEVAVSSITTSPLNQTFSSPELIVNNDSLQLPIDDALIIDALNNLGGLSLSVVNTTNNNRASTQVYPNNASPEPAVNSGPPTVSANGIIYIGRGDQLYAYDSAGTLITGWPVDIQEPITTQPALSLNENTVYVGGGDRHLVAVGGAEDVLSGQIHWQFPAAGAVASPLVDQYDFVYAGAMDSRFYSLGTDGQVRWTYNATAGIAEKPVIYGDYSLSFSSVDGQLHQLRAGVIGPEQLNWQSIDQSLLRDYLTTVGEDFEQFVVDGWDATELFQVGRLFEGLLRRHPDKETLTFWTYALLPDYGATLEEVTEAFLTSDSGVALYGGLTDFLYVGALYENVLNITEWVDTPEYQADLAALTSGALTRTQLAMQLVGSEAFSTRVDQELLRIFQIFYGFCLEANCDFLLDSDNDGLGDQWELTHFGDLTSQSGDGDADGDGLTNYQEYLANTSPALGAPDAAPQPAAMPDAPDTSTSDLIGSLEGQFRVNEQGAATYSIPITLPQGTAGVAPEVSLQYSSQNRNALLGQGWSLTASSAISRCRQTLGQDNTTTAIRWNSDDRFCLNGQRLILVDGAYYGAVGAQYRTEVESFMYITSVGGSDGAPDYFTAIAKDGSLSTYGREANGNNAQQRTPDDAHTVSWTMSAFKDSVGNSIDYYYEHTAGSDYRLTRIDYAYGNGTTANAYVTFEYTDAERPDVQRDYISGYRFSVTKRLVGIHVYNVIQGTASAIRDYTLEYEDYPADQDDQTSRLSSVTTCVQSTCLPPTTFAWEYYTEGQASTASDVITFTNPQLIADYSFGDVDGDGEQDIFFLFGGLEPVRLGYATMSEGNLQRKNFASGEDHVFINAVLTEVAGISRPGPISGRIEPFDYNADGRSDLAVYAEGDGGWTIYVSTPTTDGWLLQALDDSHFIAANHTLQFIDVNSDGLSDIVYLDDQSRVVVRHLEPSGAAISSNTFYHFGNATTYTLEMPAAYANRDTPVRDDLSSSVGDINGDGVPELLIRYRYIGDAPVGTAVRQFQFYYDVYSFTNGGLEPLDERFFVGESRVITGGLASELGRVSLVDLNGDGLSDRVTTFEGEVTYALSNGVSFEAEHTLLLTRGDGENEFDRAPTFTDFDADGDVDILYLTYPFKQLRMHRWDKHAETFNASSEYVRPAGTGGDPNIRENHIFVDGDGDGALDYFRYRAMDGELSRYPSLHSGPVNVVSEITNGLGGVTEITYEPLSQSDHYSRLEVGETLGALLNQVCTREDIGDLMLCESYYQLDASQFYSALNANWSGHHTLGKYQPVLEFRSAYPIVTDIASSAPAAGATPGIDPTTKSHISYYYAAAKMQAAGRGFLGFERLTSIDEQMQIQTVTTYRQDFPFHGRPHMTEVFTPEGERLSQLTNTWAIQGWQPEWASTLTNNGSVALGPLQVHMANSTETTFVSATDSTQLDGLRVSDSEQQSTLTTNTYDDWGNVTEVIVDTRSDGFSHVKTITNHYDSGLTLGLHGQEGQDFTYAQMGRVRQTDTVIVQNGETSETRTAVFTYHTSGNHVGMMATETVEPRGSANDQLSQALTIEYFYDDFGNQRRVESRGWDGHQSVTRYEESLYDSIGRYMVSSTNSYGQVTQTTLEGERNSLGQPTKVTDINGVATYFHYGAFGRQSQSYSENGAWTQTLMRACDSSCPTSAVYIQDTTQAGGGQSRTFIDVLGRTLREAATSFDGRWVNVDMEYDALGRMVRRSEPYFASDSAQFWTEIRYDRLSRPVETRLPGITGTARVAYNGLSTTSTNPLSQNKTEIRNGLGQLVEVIDHMGGRLAYTYDLQGDLATSTHHGTPLEPQQVQVKMCYDHLGRKTAMLDPDKGGAFAQTHQCPTQFDTPIAGWWLYRYNAFGELISQLDAKGQASTLTYDLLGRTTARIDTRVDGSIEGNTQWEYNNAVLGDDLGVLEHVEDSISGYRQTYVYDTLTRLSETHTRLAANDDHYEKITYDQFGRALQAFDAAGDQRFQSSAIENIYNDFGFLRQVVNANRVNGEKQTYYEVLATDERGNVISSRSGNGVTTEHDYDDATGRLSDMWASSQLGNRDIQFHHYEWDDANNLSSRSDNSAGKALVESFSYDDLNRLLTTQVTGSSSAGLQEIRYDSLGNIIFKTGVGDYHYGSDCANGFGPHAVCHTSEDNAAYAYDANGNLDNDGTGRTLVYSTFDKAIEIQKGEHTTAFRYAPNRSRYLRTDTSSAGVTTTRYIGKVEKVTHSDGRQSIKRYLPGGTLVTLTLNGSGTKTGEKTEYLHKDHLGSLDVITDVNGVIARDSNNREQVFSFDAWGQRRSGQSWEALLANELSHFTTLVVDASTPRGFTMHEHLDAVGLIHMNGRIYDPRLARFIQADPFIQAATNTQSYNRYSYVFNNPLNASDPSGYFSVGFVNTLFQAAQTVISIVAAVNCGACAAYFAAGFAATNTAIAGGNLGDIAIAAVTAYASATATSNLGLDGFNEVEILQLGVLGGVTSVLNGGKFGHGFISAGVGAAVGGRLAYSGSADLGANIMRGVASSVIGGSVSSLTGGKFGNGAAYAAFSWAVSGGLHPSTEESIFQPGSGENPTGDRNINTSVEDSRLKSIDRIKETALTIDAAMEGNSKARRHIRKYFKTDKAEDLAEIKRIYSEIANELATATILEGDADYIARRRSQGSLVGAWVSQDDYPDTIFFNPGIAFSEDFEAMLVHEAAHLAGIRGHKEYDGEIVYGNELVKKFTRSAGWSGARENPSNFSCAVYPDAKSC
ncbi:Ig-like domain-containing protein [Agarilytica rhodophyticola]|uniref:Ig-like domain-containing protein n=1 Tax=Agarilytica rhodophyticola TaxID=1737490 RepID=UPI000B34335D|nr:Ig-like domain-containing protein [Agarilytica rhodophyticola]